MFKLYHYTTHKHVEKIIDQPGFEPGTLVLLAPHSTTLMSGGVVDYSV